MLNASKIPRAATTPVESLLGLASRPPAWAIHRRRRVPARAWHGRRERENRDPAANASSSSSALRPHASTTGRHRHRCLYLRGTDGARAYAARDRPGQWPYAAFAHGMRIVRWPRAARVEQTRTATYSETMVHRRDHRRDVAAGERRSCWFHHTGRRRRRRGFALAFSRGDRNLLQLARGGPGSLDRCARRRRDARLN